MSNKKYFAFISYSHKDSEMAKWLQHEFEYYELPAKLFDERKELHKENLPESFRPIFRDEDELAGGELKPQISKALADSEYLIVICSPNASNSIYVDNEIKEFIQLSHGNKRKIFPLIIDGKPHQDALHKGIECFPKTLLELSEDKDDPIELIAGDIKATGRDHAFVKILAGILKEKDIKFSDLWDRYSFEKAERERKDREDKEKLQIAQSRFVAEKSLLISNENSNLALRLALEVLPHSIINPNRPFAPEAELALRRSVSSNNYVLCAHNNKVTNISFSPDGHRLLSQSSDSVIVWDLDTCQILRTINGSFIKAGFYKNGNNIITFPLIYMGSRSRLFRLWKDGARIWSVVDDKKKRIKKIDSLEDYILASVSYSNNANQMVLCNNSSLYLLDFEQFTVKKLIVDENVFIHFSTISPDGKKVAASITKQNGSSNIDEVIIWDINNSLICCKLSGHTDRVSSICFNYDGKKVITGSWDRSIKIWDSNTGKEIKTLSGHNKRIFSIDLSADGKKIVSGSEDGSIIIWDFMSGGLIDRHNTDDIVQHVSFSPDGRLIAYLLNDNKIRILGSFEDKFISRHLIHDYFILKHSIAIDKSNKCLAISVCNVVLLIDLQTIRVNRYLIGHNNLVDSVAFNKDGSRLVSTYCDGTIIVWDVVAGTSIHKISLGNDVPFYSTVYSPNDNFFITNSWDGTLRKWDDNTGKMLWTIPNSTSVDRIDISPDGTNFVSVDKKQNLVVRDSKDGMIMSSLPWKKSHVFTPLSYSPEGDEIVFVDEYIHKWNISTGIVKNSTTGFESVRSVDYSPNRKTILLGSIAFELFIIDADTLLLKKNVSINDTVDDVRFLDSSRRLITLSLEGDYSFFTINRNKSTVIQSLRFSGDITFASVSPNGKEIAIVCEDNYPIGYIRNVDTCYVVRLLIGHDKPISKIEYAPDGKFIATLAKDRKIIIWDAFSGEMYRDYYEEGFTPLNFVFSPYGKEIAIIVVDDCGGRFLKVYDIMKDILLFCIPLCEESVNSIDYSQDGEIIAIVNDSDIILLNAKSGEFINILREQMKTRNKFLKFHYDGRSIISITNEKEVSIWDIETGLKNKYENGQMTDIMAISQDGQYVASVCSDNYVRIWSLTTGSLVHYFKLKEIDDKIKYVVFGNNHIILIVNHNEIYDCFFPPLQELIDEANERFKDNPLSLKERKQYYLE